ncbi:MAG: carbonic anhydrase [Pirellulaceae bacterium]
MRSIRLLIVWIVVMSVGVSGSRSSCDEPTKGTANQPSAGDNSPASRSPGDHHSEATKQSIVPESALAQLLEGNRRFVDGTPIHPHSSADYRASLATEQHPFATVLTCSDSRVTPVLIFDQGIGDLFVISVAGNVIDDDVAASIEYAVDHLGTKLVVIMGHENCGALTAAYHSFIARDLKAREPHEIESLLMRLEPAVRKSDPSKSVEEQISAAVEANVRLGAESLLRLPDIRAARDEKKVRIVGAIYSLRTGAVRILDL